MKVIDASHEVVQALPGLTMLSLLEDAARVCYKSEDKKGPGTAEKLLSRIIDQGHTSVLEHCVISVHIICDRGVSHELVRHRTGIAFSQESTRYANYADARFGGECSFIRPFFWDNEKETMKMLMWKNAMEVCEQTYLTMLKAGASPQEARTVLPNSLKTEILVTANVREWRHIFGLRCAKAAHPQMREVMLPILRGFHFRFPLLFDDLAGRFHKDLYLFHSQEEQPE
jgi:thymidylate synthase (FAD)